MSAPTMPWVTIRHDIPFHDVDMLDMVWHGHHYKYFELARTALFRKYGLDVAQMRELDLVMVVIDSSCRYHKPLRYGQEVEIHAEIIELEMRIEIEYMIRDPETGTRLAKGGTTQVAVDPKKNELLFSTPTEIIARFRRREKEIE